MHSGDNEALQAAGGAETTDFLPDESIQELAAHRRRTSLQLSAIILVIYFGFVLAVAFMKDFMGETLAPGLSWGILAGAGVILTSFGLTGVYVRWANRQEAALAAARMTAPAQSGVTGTGTSSIEETGT